MRVMSIILGGCLKAPPVDFGITEDTGGHITYALGAGLALAARPEVQSVELVTRLIDDETLGPAYSRPHERIAASLWILRVDSGNRRYLAKEANVADRPAFTAALIAHIERHGAPDVIYAHFADAAEVALALRERFGIPFIYTAHSLGADKAACGIVEPAMARRLALEGSAIASADAIVASSRDEAERQLMLYPGADPARIHRIPPGARLAGSTTASPDLGRSLVAPFLRDPDKPVILAIARPVAKKNLTGLVDLYASHPNLRDLANLVIVAGLRDAPDSGEEEQRTVIAGLLDRLDRHDLYGSLALPKRHSQAAVASLYSYAQATGGVFANPALTEPYGLTLTEAASHGLPVVATDQGGPPDIVAQLGHGVVADPTDQAAFGEALAAILTDRRRWTAASVSGRERSRALGWPAYAEAFVGVMQRILARPASAPIARPERLLLCDIDNTLTGCRNGAGALAARIRQEPQLAFGVATGRSLQEAQRLLAECPYPDPSVLITSVGSEVYWRTAHGLRADNAWLDAIADGWDRDGCATVLAAMPGLALQPPVEQRRFKLSYFADEPTARDVRERLRAAGLAARVTHSHGSLLDVLPQDAGKGAAMKWVARALGLPLESVWAAGDSGNDLDMLEACPNPIIVANHDAQLAQLAVRPHVFVSQGRHAGGIVEALERRPVCWDVAA